MAPRPVTGRGRANRRTSGTHRFYGRRHSMSHPFPLRSSPHSSPTHSCTLDFPQGVQRWSRRADSPNPSKASRRDQRSGRFIDSKTWTESLAALKGVEPMVVRATWSSVTRRSSSIPMAVPYVANRLMARFVADPLPRRSSAATCASLRDELRDNSAANGRTAQNSLATVARCDQRNDPLISPADTEEVTGSNPALRVQALLESG
jgi:hypothetical protein